MLNFRKYCDSDFEGVLETIRTYSEEHYELAKREIPHMIAMEGTQFYVCEDDNLIIAVLGYRKDINPEAKGIYWAEYSYVRPQYQRKGISTRLWDIIEDELRRLGCRKIYIDIGNKSEHIVAINQYLKRGYKQEGACPDFWDEGEDWLIFAKRLTKKQG